ncbi:hypothetical protein D9Q98_006516 [Chlorella vulgaris]|uniref:Ubiquinol oxidase n=1 Tax=Chlorella vulgaris TaxID=3077 RepID=A0A9D4TKE2_CHLVU|nr:hypothetical protein D9Q98_006516 [Chlorella vulgaris]
MQVALHSQPACQRLQHSARKCRRGSACRTSLRVGAAAQPSMPASGSRPSAVPSSGGSSSGNGKGMLTNRTGRLAFLDEEGQVIRPMPADYGFRSGGARLYQQDYGTIPKGVVELSLDNFKRELRSLRRAVRYNELAEVAQDARQAGSSPGLLGRVGFAAGQAVRSVFARLDIWLEQRNVLNELTQAPQTEMEGELTAEQKDVLAKLRRLTLDDAAVSASEKSRLAAAGGPRPSLPIRAAYTSLCWVLDVVYGGRPIERFWVLETVARMPYFVWISLLHLYESLGWWRAGAELRKVHFAEEWNELHHLQIMEALGGDLRWGDRFLAEHAAVFYYWTLVVIYLISPAASYQFMEMVEGHAADTYAQFAAENKDMLETIPPPLVALNYYKSGDLYLFDEFQTSWRASGDVRRPRCNTLYDVFCNIRDDELEHVKTMVACQDGSIALDLQNAEAMAELASQEKIATLPPWDSDDEEGTTTRRTATKELQ